MQVPSPARPVVVGVLNLTPDSFSDGGRFVDDDGTVHVERAVQAGVVLVDQGADWLDIGGESTRPGAPAVSAQVEIARTARVIRGLAAAVPQVRLCIDTSKPAVADAALGAGATVINDVTGLRDPQLAALTARAQATVVMHTRGTPATMRTLTDYDDVVAQVVASLLASAARARSPEVWLDPGIGFAKTAGQSLSLLRHTDALVATGHPVYIGASRKSFIGHVTGISSPAQRVPGSLAAVAAAYHGGATAFRVHDVAETRQLLDVLSAIHAAP